MIDAGDLSIPLEYEKGRSDEVMQVMNAELLKVLAQIRTIGHAFVLGGSDDMSLAVIQSAESMAVHFDACLDVKAKQVV